MLSVAWKAGRLGIEPRIKIKSLHSGSARATASARGPVVTIPLFEGDGVEEGGREAA